METVSCGYMYVLDGLRSSYKGRDTPDVHSGSHIIAMHGLHNDALRPDARQKQFDAVRSLLISILVREINRCTVF
jgi:hypothetical protein